MKVAILLLNNNGDILFATPIAKQIKEFDFPDCHLIWIVSSQCNDILKNNEYIDELEIVEVSNVKEVYANWKTIAERYTKKLIGGDYDKLFILQPYGRNFLRYSSCIRRMILDAYPFAIKVPLSPILSLTTKEKQNVLNFITDKKINLYKHRVLFEFAPSSGQSNISLSDVLNIATQIVTNNTSTCVILSSKQSLDIINNNIFNANGLSFKENAELINNCDLLIGCSSGISWLSTSSYCKQVPTIQYLNTDAPWFNSLKQDFAVNDLDSGHIVELYQFDVNLIVETCNCFFEKGLKEVKVRYDQELKKKYLVNNFKAISAYFFHVGSFNHLVAFFIRNITNSVGFVKYNFRLFFSLFKTSASA